MKTYEETLKTCEKIVTVMGTYTVNSRGRCGDEEWLTNDYEPTAADHGPDVLYEIGRDAEMCMPPGNAIQILYRVALVVKCLG